MKTSKLPGKYLQIMQTIFNKARFHLLFSRDMNRSINVLQQVRQQADPLDIPFTFRGTGEFKSILPKQVFSEIKTLYTIVKDMQPRFVCEIGTFRGGTFYLWCQAAHKNAVLISIDLPGGLGHPYSMNRIKFYQHFAIAESQQLHFMPADSHQHATLQRLAAVLGTNKLDFLFIDGDHTYPGVKRDFELYSPLVRNGGLIAFHDILPREEHPEVQVYKLWNEIKSRFSYKEIIANQGDYANMVGIGLLYKKRSE